MPREVALKKEKRKKKKKKKERERDNRGVPIVSQYLRT